MPSRPRNDLTRGALVALVLAALVAAGCASHAPVASTDGQAQRCERLYTSLDRSVMQAGVQDGGTARIPGFIYLRANRLLASLKDRAVDGAAFEAWVDRLQQLDVIGRRYEWANLPLPQRARLVTQFPELDRDAMPAIETCGKLLSHGGLSSALARNELRRRAAVPDDYDTWKRAVGVYALTRVPFAAGIRRYQRDTQAVFDQDLAALPVHGRLVAYAHISAHHLDAEGIRSILFSSRYNPLGIPEVGDQDLSLLFDTYAPTYLVDEVDDNDRIGALTLGEGGLAEVDASRPTVYRRVAYTRYGEEVLLQLVYSVWFPARPRAGNFDLLGGKLDGLTWRVTLDSSGMPLVFDAIHNCGCYHQFFPTARVQLRPQPDSLDESAFVPQWLPMVAPAQHLVLRVATGSHYIERISVEDDALSSVRAYAFGDDDALRSLIQPDGRGRSLFRPDGIVPGSQRGERWLFWPMGVREPGAMRQWGRHATAFVGRRHFDDADLIERYFEPRP